MMVESAVVAGRFRLIPFNELRPSSDAAYLVKNLVPRTGTILVWGPPKCGKSFWVFDLVMHVARGLEYRGLRTRQGTVVYLALEGATGFRNRAEALRQRFPDMTEKLPFSLMADAIDLVRDPRASIAAIRAQLDENQLPAVLVIDTLNRSLDGAESSDEDMARYIRAADAIRDAFQCAVIVVHHCGHNTGRPRGHSSLLGAVDAQIAVTRDKSNSIVCTVERMKDGPEGAAVVSRLEQVELGTDEDGDPISSCVVVPAEGDAKAVVAKPPRLTKAGAIALRALREAVENMGAVPPASNSVPPKVKTVTTKQWRDYAYRMGISSSDQARAREQALKRAFEDLIATGAVATWEPYVWLCR